MIEYFCNMDRIIPIIEIDPSAGFCSGVKRAIEAAGQLLDESDNDTYCLGDIVHNEVELQRLKKSGLKVIENDSAGNISSGSRIIIRAHGVPPSTFDKLKATGARIVDATCPVVIRLQRKISQASAEMQAVDGTVIIFGKQGHPEILGLLGNTSGNVIVISGKEDVGKLNFSIPMRIFSQTTSDLSIYNEICEIILNESEKLLGPDADVKVNQTICRQMSNRGPDIERFALLHEVVIFVSGVDSSNGKYLAGLCKNLNPQTYSISSIDQINPDWFVNKTSIGISGATSTPFWQMKQAADKINELLNN